MRSSVLALCLVLLAVTTTAPRPAASADPWLAQLETARAAALDQRNTRAMVQDGAEEAGHLALLDTALDPARDADFDAAHRNAASAARTTCARGDWSACHSLGEMYHTGTGTWPDRPLGHALFWLACNAGDGPACHALAAEACRKGIDCEPFFLAHLDVTRAARRAEHGPLEAALVEQYDDFVDEWHGPVRRLRRGCRAGDTNDCIALGRLFNGQPGGWELKLRYADVEAADALFLHACEAGDGAGCAAYTEQFRYGYRDDAARVLRYAEIGCALGSADACFTAGDSLADTDASQQALARAAAYLDTACRIGGGHACERLGRPDFEDEATRLKWEIKACAAGDSLRCEMLADYDFDHDPDMQRALAEIGCRDGNDALCAR